MTLSTTDMQSLGNPLRDLRKTFDEMIVPHRPSLWRYCYSITGSPWDAEDLVQETLIKAFSSLSQLWQPINPKSYLFKIAYNTWIDQCRRSKVKMDSIEVLGEPGSAEEIDQSEVEDAMEQLILNVPPRQRAVLLLIEVFQFKAKEVGEIIGSTEGAVKALINRARTSLKQYRGDKGETIDQVILSDEQRQLLNEYMESFNRRDPDGIARLLTDNVTNDIVHIAQEFGKDIVRKYSLTDWAKDPVDMKAELHILWGRPVIVQIGKMDDSFGVYDINYVEIENKQIVSVKDYYFCPELLHKAAEELHLEVFPRNYVF